MDRDAGRERAKLSRDVRAYYRKRFAHGTLPEIIDREPTLTYSGLLDEPAFQLGLAQGRWDCGVLEPETLVLLGQTDGHEETVRRLREPNPTPDRVQRVFRHPIYEPGDCLAVPLSDGDYGAALVLASDTRAGRGYGNLADTLRYKDAEVPATKVFERREWLALTHHHHDGRTDLVWRSAGYHPRTGGANLIRLGRSPLRADDPRESLSSTGWNIALRIEMQDAWERGVR